MQKIKLYHISYDLTEPLEKEFVPRIPNNAATGEDESIPRICFCDSIERCLNAAEDNFGDYEVADKATIIVWENEFSLSDEKLLNWQHLYENKKFKINYDSAEKMAEFTQSDVVTILQAKTKEYVSALIKAYQSAFELIANKEQCYKIIRGLSEKNYWQVK